MRKGLLRRLLQGGDALLARFEQNVFEAIETLAADHDTVSGAAAVFVATGQIKPGTSFVVFRGSANQTLYLPKASALGDNVGTMMAVINNSASVPVTLAATAKDQVDLAPTLGLPLSSCVLLLSDGQTSWTSV